MQGREGRHATRGMQAWLLVALLLLSMPLSGGCHARVQVPSLRDALARLLSVERSNKESMLASTGSKESWPARSSSLASTSSDEGEGSLRTFSLEGEGGGGGAESMAVGGADGIARSAAPQLGSTTGGMMGGGMMGGGIGRRWEAAEDRNSVGESRVESGERIGEGVGSGASGGIKGALGEAVEAVKGAERREDRLAGQLRDERERERRLREEEKEGSEER